MQGIQKRSLEDGQSLRKARVGLSVYPHNQATVTQ